MQHNNASSQDKPEKNSESKPNPNQAFIDMEHKWLEHWYKTGITEKYLHKNDSANETFSFMDGPITANNPMGVHHAWGRSYKDLWQKFHNLLGHKQRFQNGFDCQGLWVEVEVEKELGLKSKKDIENLVPGDKKASIAKFVQLCKDRVLKFSEIQTQQSKRLGYFMHWDNSYYTMSAENNYMIWHFLKKCFENGWIYKGHDSVPWCPRCGTSISQHEMLTEDYSEVQHETVFFKLKIVQEDLQKVGTSEQAYFLAWTTTPWTVPGNVAIAVNTEINYNLIKTESGLHLILAESRVKDSIKEKYEVIKTFTGEELIGIRYEAPFDELERIQEAKAKNPETFHTIVNGSEIVTETEGTGILHVAPGQGQEDFNLGKEFKLSVIELIDEDASYYKGLGEFSGQNAKEKPGMIFKFLKEHANGEFFYKTQSYRHRYPLCWRCKTELVWRVVDEWYIAMDRPSANGKDKRTLRQRMVTVAKQINWIPEFGLDRELDWLDKMHDWLISKKRYWGLALPIWVSEDGKEFEVIGGEDELKERAIEGYEELEGHTPHRPYIDNIKIKSASGKIMSRVPDVGNVWLDAGIVPYSTITDPKTGKVAYISNKDFFNEWFPIDLITESFPGQFKNWFYSMIAMSTVLEDTNPYETVIGYATLLAEDGRAMHKSWGNSIEFNEGADKIGVDVMRWMYARQNYTDNMLFGYKRGDEVRRQVYLLIWNIYKFFMEYGQLDGINYKECNSDLNPELSNNVLDKWILNRMVHLVTFSKQSLLAYNIRDFAMETEAFINDLSTWYLRRSRDRVWMHAESEEDKKQFYKTLYSVLVNLSVILSPVMPFITEEIYTALTGNESVHLASWPVLAVKTPDNGLIEDMKLVRSIVEAGHRTRKETKIKVRQPLPHAFVTLPKDMKIHHSEFDPAYKKLIAEELNVKDVSFKAEPVPVEANVTYDTNLSEELIMEGKVRELIRSIQAERKKLSVKLDQKIKLTIPGEYKGHEQEIAKAVLTESIAIGPELKVE